MDEWFSIVKIKPYERVNSQYLLKDAIWEESGATGQPTIEELEKLLGRKLVKDDFQLYAPLTWGMALHQPQVLERIGREGIIQGIDEFVKNPLVFRRHNSHWYDLPKSFKRDILRLTKVLNELNIDPKKYLEEFNKNAIDINEDFDYDKLFESREKVKEEE